MAAFGDLFGELLGRNKAGPPRGNDLRIDLELDLAEVDTGGVHPVEVRRGKLCRTCTGTGYEPATSLTSCMACKGKGQVFRTSGATTSAYQCAVCLGSGKVGMPCDGCMGMGTQPAIEKFAVTVPAGIGDGMTLRLANKGDEIRDGASGHLYVAVAVRAHPKIVRRDNDLVMEAWVPRELAAAGGAFVVASLHGNRTIDVPAATKDRDQLVVRGCGLQIFDAPKTPLPVDTAPGDSPYRELDTSGRGNLVVTLRVREAGAVGWLKRVLNTDRL